MENKKQKCKARRNKHSLWSNSLVSIEGLHSRVGDRARGEGLLLGGRSLQNDTKQAVPDGLGPAGPPGPPWGLVVSFPPLPQRESDWELPPSQAKIFLIYASLFTSHYCAASGYPSRPELSLLTEGHWVPHTCCSIENKIRSGVFIILFTVMRVTCSGWQGWINCKEAKVTLISCLVCFSLALVLTSQFQGRPPPWVSVDSRLGRPALRKSGRTAVAFSRKWKINLMGYYPIPSGNFFKRTSFSVVFLVFITH